MGSINTVRFHSTFVLFEKKNYHNGQFKHNYTGTTESGQYPIRNDKPDFNKPTYPHSSVSIVLHCKQGGQKQRRGGGEMGTTA